MKNKFLFLGLVLLLFCINSVYAIEWPSKMYGQPEIFTKLDESEKWDKAVRNRNFGELTQNPWIVYVVNEGAKAYDNPTNASKIVVNDIRFMDNFYVADISGDFALLFYCDNKDLLYGLQIPSEIKSDKSKYKQSNRTNGYIGWVHLDDLLLWTICPKTTDGIFKKIAIVKDVDEMTRENVNKAPKMYKNSSCSEYAGRNLNALDFYFAIKKDAVGNVLVYRNYKLLGDMRHEAIGWVEKGQFIDWNTRICWEPAFGRGIAEYAYSFQSAGEPEDLFSDRAEFAKDYYDGELSQSIDKVKVAKIKLTEKRKSIENTPRSPVIEYEDNVAQLSVLANSLNGATEGPDPEEILNKIRILEQSLSKINIVFVMDATNSMKDCFSAMSKSVINISKTSIYEEDKVNFGVVVFRNYEDERNGLLLESCPLTGNIQTISNFLNNVKCTSVSPEPQEAMFYGLNYAADNMGLDKDNSNFVILISDVTTKDPDKKDFTSKKIVEKFKQKGINLVAFQARSQREREYQNFSSQIMDMVTDLLKCQGYSTSDVTTTNGISIYEQKGSNIKWPLRPMGYKFKASDDQNINSKELEDMAVTMIKEFIVVTEENISKLRASMSGGEIEVDYSVCEELIRRKIIKDCKDLANIGLKVTGYSSQYNNNGEKMFVPCVFFADEELNQLISDIERVTRNTVVNKRKELQVICKKLILSYTGQRFDPELLDRDFVRIAKEIRKECGYKFYPDALDHISNPNLLEDDAVESLINQLRSDLDRLKKVQIDKNNYKVQEGGLGGKEKMKYFYVLLKDMPLVIDINK